MFLKNMNNKNKYVQKKTCNKIKKTSTLKFQKIKSEKNC